MTTPLQTVVRRLRFLAEPEAVPDRELLTRFQTTREEAAFAALVARHGGTVWSVCRRVLGDVHHAEDAFQATFLVLVRNAHKIRQATSVGCWLYGVAYRVACKYRTQLQRTRTATLPDVPASDTTTRTNELRNVLDEELLRLPERLRQPVLLCYVDGLTRDEAATVLGCKLSTLRGRLEDGRERLRQRLAQRGLDLTTLMLAIATVDEVSAMNPTLLETTSKTLLANPTPHVHALATGILPTLSFTKWATAATVVLLTLGLSTATALYHGEPTETPKKADLPKQDEATKVRDALAALKAKAASADRIWVVETKKTDDGKPPEPSAILKGSTPPTRGFSFTYDAEELQNLPAKGAEKWIVFLRSVDEARDFKPQVEPLTRKDWYIPYDPVTAATLGAYVPVFEWGQTGSDLRLGLRVRDDSDETVVEVALTNVGKQNRTIEQFRGNYFDGWPDLTFTLTTPDKRQYTLGRPGRPHKDGDAPRERTLPPGDTYVQAVRCTRWSIISDGLSPSLPNLYKPRGSYTLTAHFKSAKKPTDPAWHDQLTSATLTLKDPVSAPSPSTLTPQQRQRIRHADQIWIVPSPTAAKPVPTAESVLKGPPHLPRSIFDLRLLPADDPQKKWIVFLQTPNADAPAPDLKLAASDWYWPYDANLARYLREEILPKEWSKVSEGMSLGFKVHEREFPVGAPIHVEVTLRNTHHVKAWDVPQFRYNIYDYWPGLHFNVKTTSGEYILTKPEGRIDEKDAPNKITLKPGEYYTHKVRLDTWTGFPTEGDSDRKKNLLRPAGHYTVTARYTQNGNGLWKGTLASKPVEWYVQDPTKNETWGQETDGLQLRLRLTKETVKTTDLLTFTLALRNRGKEMVGTQTKAIPYLCKVELDGHEYSYLRPGNGSTGLTQMAPDAQIDNWCEATINNEWSRAAAPPPTAPDALKMEPFKLTPGKHTLRVTYTILGNKATLTTAPLTFMVE